jgi:hypothetical protein
MKKIKKIDKMSLVDRDSIQPMDQIYLNLDIRIMSLWIDLHLAEVTVNEYTYTIKQRIS